MRLLTSKGVDAESEDNVKMDCESFEVVDE